MDALAPPNGLPHPVPGLTFVAMETDGLAARLAEVRERIERARQRAGRTDGVTLVAVTKTHPPAVVQAAIRAGVADVGENRVQELGDKVDAVGRRAVRWHLIGHLQRNKVAKALPLFDLLHSLDSVRLAETLSAEAVKAGVTVRALVEVNSAGEATKGGFPAAGAVDAVGRILELPGIELAGMMTMAPFTDDQAVVRRAFAATRELRDEAARQLPAFRGGELSMGMSNDFEIAVEEGATLVRVGSSIFGERG
ncbi:YggS family pyridoxal phosphate-dependent enzyme [Longimicrobium sp.]|uniref:YggS family pyridoxal phosphate-dependent enzyme n=1 Tax=Longimicrobium sp. TaxID=2029185 RepID=UPI002C8C9401|nr:YggS family pyridoxal phosphate-dependent enzyme [Longimicrobium sp.]HSU17937.1 YggS family pyridoxal phosphate-dependent enzyme [Longimicrobium sp.]